MGEAMRKRQAVPFAFETPGEKSKRMEDAGIPAEQALRASLQSWEREPEVLARRAAA